MNKKDLLTELSLISLFWYEFTNLGILADTQGYQIRLNESQGNLIYSLYLKDCFGLYKWLTDSNDYRAILELAKVV